MGKVIPITNVVDLKAEREKRVPVKIDKGRLRRFYEEQIKILRAEGLLGNPPKK